MEVSFFILQIVLQIAFKTFKLTRKVILSVCRTTDLYLSSKVKTGMKERPRLNLTVRKELQDMGGKIVAQSGLALVSILQFNSSRIVNEEFSHFSSLICSDYTPGS